MSNNTAFGGMLQRLVEITSVVMRPALLEAEVERVVPHSGTFVIDGSVHVN
jgi:hypothetical protein